MKKERDISILGLTIVCLLFAMSVQAQEGIKKELPTGKVNRKVNETKKSEPKGKKKISYIYVLDGEKLLIGNPCATQATRKMGFEYELQHRPDDRFNSHFQRVLHNTGVKMKLIFTRGPWWKATVNKKLKNCAIQSGDFRG